VNDDGRVIVEVDNEVLGASANTADGAPLDSSEDVFDPVARQDAGKIANTQRPDALTDDLVDQGAANGFDFGEFWHTRMTVARMERCG
jgi:hypothetical protein